MIFKKHQKNGHKNDFWIGFSDLMTGLMLVFIVLSLTFIAIAQQRITEAENAKKRIEELRNEAKDKIRESKKRRSNIIVVLSEKLATNNITVEFNSEKGTVTIAQDILFEWGKPDLNPQGKDFIRLFSKILENNIFNNDEYKDLIKYIHIEGYASKEGTIEHNFMLSFERAKNVWFYMTNNNLKNENIMKQKLNIVSRGEIDADQSKVNTNDRKVIFRFEFYDDYNKIVEELSKK